MLKVPDYEFWFVVGSQHLYGEDILAEVRSDTEDIVKKLNESGKMPYPIRFKTVVTTADEITAVMKEANFNDKVAGVMTWMHTYSPAKNWIRGTKLLQKPLMHLATQYLDHIPYDSIDFDYMNLNQSAHGDREYGYINARLQKHNKVVYGHWADPEVQSEIADWEDVAVAYNESFNIKVARFGDTMRNVAVTEGDKVQGQIQFGWTVDYWPVGNLVEEMDKVSEQDIDAKYEALKSQYTFVQGHNDPAKYEHSVRYQLREYFGIKALLDKGGYTAFSTNFEDLFGMEQLPGLAVQLLMAEGYGFAGEGDWKTAALDRLLKIMTNNDRTVFMEDYTLELTKGNEAILGSHMLEVDPTIASGTPRIEVHPLGIGGKDDPARLVFDGIDGDAMDVTISDFGTEFRMIGYGVNAHKPTKSTPHLPIAKQYWTPKMGLKEGATKWIQNGGGHHTVLTFTASEQQIQDLATLFQLPFIDIK